LLSTRKIVFLDTVRKPNYTGGAAPYIEPFQYFCSTQRVKCCCKDAVSKSPFGPGYWSNTCCSHPRQGESNGIATQRRLKEELGVAAPLSFTHQFRYQAQFDDFGAEHELCSVYVGCTDATPSPNPQEISDWQWISPNALDDWLDRTPETLTPWFKIEWAALRSGHHADTLESIGLKWHPGGA
jgi:isopentenyl-diphosphate delta-isomerase